ncbi:MAG: response regulator [Planctomycetota bacterium]|nr:MAG: response regulator [Planctomycetota bacterium]
MRTPMTSVLGYTEMLLDGQMDATQTREALESIYRNGKHLLGLIEDILDLFKIQGGRMTCKPVTCSPHEVIADAVSGIRPLALNKGLSFDVRFATALPETIRTDPKRLRQILVNLLGNAVKYTDEGFVRLTVSLHEESGAKRFCFDVEDSGIGIPEDRHSEVFEPFTQVNEERMPEGTGIGLPIARYLARLLGGDLRIIASAPGEGTHMRATIDPGALENVPLVSDSASRMAVREEAASAPDAARLDGRILLAEDAPDNRRILTLLLEQAGAMVVTAQDGQEAVTKALLAREEGQPFDVILMDLEMPVLSGKEAVQMLREAEYERPIIALTAHATDDHRKECAQAGCDDFLTKPVTRDRLYGVIQTHMVRQPEAIGAGSGD